MYRKNPKAMVALKEFLKEKERLKKEKETEEVPLADLDGDADLDTDTDLGFELTDDSTDDEEIEATYYNDGPFNLYIEHSELPDSGLGVYTEDFIPENTIIGEYTGEIIESYNLTPNDYFYELLEPDEQNGVMGIGIDASNLPRCYMAMINDAQFSKKFSNNVMFEASVEEKKIYVVSLRDIEPDEELFVSYGEGYWNVE